MKKTKCKRCVKNKRARKIAFVRNKIKEYMTKRFAHKPQTP